MATFSAFARGARATLRSLYQRTWDRSPFLFSAFALYVPTIILINEHLVEVVWVNGASMSPLFNEDYHETARRDVALSWKWLAPMRVERGMVVVFRSPVSPEDRVIKRVVGVSGDTIVTRRGSKYSPGLPVIVPPGHIWVEGDGRPGTTLDSNTYGPIAKGLVESRITHVLWPPRKFGKLRWWDWEGPMWREHDGPSWKVNGETRPVSK